jgi:glycopeptide antibiotics resistance protein
MRKHLFLTFVLVAYCAILIKVMVFKDMPTFRIGSLMLNFSGTEAGHAPNFVPFKTILPYLLGYKGIIIAGVNLIGNIALLVPIGFLVPFVYRNMTWKKSLVLAVAAGFTIEITQVLLDVGIFDIDDIILNALGVMIGYWAFVILAKWLRSKNYKSVAAAVIIVIAAMAVGFYVIYPQGKPVNSGKSASGVQSGRMNNKEEEIPQNGDDLCGGTGGIGPIIKVGNNSITIKRNDGVIQNIKLTGQTKIRTSVGPVSKSALKVGERVTLVIDASETASLVLVCDVSHPASRPGYNRP